MLPICKANLRIKYYILCQELIYLLEYLTLGEKSFLKLGFSSLKILTL